jgi:serine/threonine protein kinase
LSHPNVLRLFGCCCEPQNYGIMMELVEGVNLFNLIHTSKVPKAQVESLSPLLLTMTAATESVQTIDGCSELSSLEEDHSQRHQKFELFGTSISLFATCSH